MDNHDFYSEYVHEGNCLPEIAACLILDVVPEKVLQKDPSVFCGFIINQQNVKDLALLLKLFKLSNPTTMLSLFAFVDYTLKNNKDVSQILINKISRFCSNYIPVDLKLFCEKHPYLGRALDLDQQKPVNNLSNIKIKIDKITKWQSMYKQFKVLNPNISQQVAAEKIYQELKSSDPRYIMKTSGEYISIDYIKKSLKG